eukprot:5225638-Pyramimonas_sp.AAC.1
MFARKGSCFSSTELVLSVGLAAMLPPSPPRRRLVAVLSPLPILNFKKRLSGLPSPKCRVYRHPLGM